MIRKFMIVAAGLAGLWAAPAHASYVCTYGGTDKCTDIIDTGSVATDWNGLSTQTLSIPLFDPTNNGAGSYTLTSVTVKIYGGLSIVSGGITNNTASATFNFTETTAYTVAVDNSTPNANLLSDLIASGLGNGSTLKASYTTGNISIANGQTISLAGDNATNAQVNLTNTADFLGTGNGQSTLLDITTLTGSTTLGGGGNLSSNLATDGDFKVNLTYNFAPSAPEPISMALLGSGIAGLAFIRRRRRTA